VKTIHGLNIPGSLADLTDPARLALVVYDMQVGVCGQIANAEQVTAAVGRVLAAARAAGVRTVFTRHMSLPRELMGVMAYRTAMAWQHADDPAKVAPWFTRDSPGFALVSQLQPLPSEVVFDKITMSAFEGTPLGITLRDCGVTAVAFVGVAMEVGIEPSARHAADLGFIPIIIADACGFGNATAAARSLEALRYSGDAMIADEAEFISALAAAGAAPAH
jgi:nicotinamidase-related amidase